MAPKWLGRASILALASTLIMTGLPIQQAKAAALPEMQGSEQQGNSGAIISPSLDVKSTSPVSIIVQFVEKPAAVASSGESIAATEIENEQNDFVSLAKQQGIQLQIGRKFQTVLNGLEVSLPANQIPLLATLPGVKSVYPNRMLYAMGNNDNTADVTLVNEAPYLPTGVREAWNMGLTGKGVKVGIVDTGIDYHHPDLVDAYKGGYNVLSHTDDPYEDLPTGGTPGTNHGTSIASIIAGRGSNTGGTIADKGIAYESEVHVYKVLGYDPATGKSSGSSAQVIEGLERAVEDGMDIINMSLGSSNERDPNTPDAVAVNNAVLAGKVVVVAAGSSSEDNYSINSPGQSPLAISVGAAAVNYAYYTVATDSYGDRYGLMLMAKALGRDNLEEILEGGPIDAVYAGLGLEKDYVGKDVTGKVVFLSRGISTFVDKASIAKKHGAKAVIIFNGINTGNQPDLSESITDSNGNNRDGYIYQYFQDTPELPPTFDMQGAEGRALAQKVKNSSTGFTFTFDIDRNNPDVGQMDIIGTRGPLLDGNLSIKPDLVAPGMYLVAAAPAFGGDYSNAYTWISGSSPATAFVTGAAALLKQQHPEWGPFEIRAALANSASPVTSFTGSLFDVYSQGSGLVQVEQAASTPAVLETVEPISILDKDLKVQHVINYNSSLGFGLLTPGTGEKTKDLQIKNSSDQPLNYTASVVMHPDVTSGPLFNKPSSVDDIHAELIGVDSEGKLQVDPQGITPFQIQLTADASAELGTYEGEIVLAADHAPPLHLPFVVQLGTELPDTGLGIQELELSSPLVTRNSDQSIAPINASVRLTASDMKKLVVKVYGLDDNERGTLSEYVQRDSGGTAQTLPLGRINLPPINGTYTDKDGNTKQLDDGMYKLFIYGYTSDSSGVNDYDYLYVSMFGVKLKVTADADQSSVIAPSTAVTADGVSTSTVTVTVKDAAGNALIGKSVSLSAESGSSVIEPSQVATGADGTAVFTVSDTTAETVTYKAVVAEDNVTVTQKAAVTFAAGDADPAQSSVTASSVMVPAEFGGEATVTVTLSDAFGNPVSGKDVSLSAESGSSVITPNSAVTDADGKASFTVSDALMETVTYSAFAPDFNMHVNNKVQISFVYGTPPAITPSTPSGIFYDEAPVTVQTQVYGQANAVASLKWAQGLQDLDYFHIGSNGHEIVNGSFMVPANDIYTVYVKDTAGNENLGTIEVNSLRPRSHDSTLSLLTLNGSYTGIALDPVYNPLHQDYSATVSNSVSIVKIVPVAEEEHATITVNGVPVQSGHASNGIQLQTGSNTITVVVTAHDLTTTSTYSITVTRKKKNNNHSGPATDVTVTPTSPSGEDADGSITVPKDNKPVSGNDVAVIVNGKPQEQVAASSITETEGRTEVNVSVNADKLMTQLEEATPGSSIVIPVSQPADIVSTELNGAVIKRMEQQQTLLEVQTSLGTYRLPAAGISIDQVSSQFGGKADLSDIKVQVEIKKGSEELVDRLKQNDPTLNVIGTPVEFAVAATYNGQSVEISSFDRFVERSIALPAGVSGDQVTTAVVINPDNTVRPVPTTMIHREAADYAVINSMTNSTYALISSTHTFTDMSGHWSEASVNNMASRLILQGVSPQQFLPDAPITRAQFAAILVRGLGLPDKEIGSSFQDVKADDWFNGAVEQAHQRGIIEGYDNDHFYPDNTITREEAFVMMSRAMKLAGAEQSAQPADADLSAFTDSSQLASWAKDAAVSAMRAGIVQGTGKELNPEQKITRAETAVLIERMLKAAKLIP